MIQVGVLLLNSGNNTEDSIYAVESSNTVEYTAFLQFLGREQIYNNMKILQSDNLLFHVNTMIQVPVWDYAKLERKRHIGNDNILILFREHQNATIELNTINSHQNMIAFIVMKSPCRRGYSVYAYKKTTVPDFEYLGYWEGQDDLANSRTITIN